MKYKENKVGMRERYSTRLAYPKGTRIGPPKRNPSHYKLRFRFFYTHKYRFNIFIVVGRLIFSQTMQLNLVYEVLVRFISHIIIALSSPAEIK